MTRNNNLSKILFVVIVFSLIPQKWWWYWFPLSLPFVYTISWKLVWSVNLLWCFFSTQLHRNINKNKNNRINIYWMNRNICWILKSMPAMSVGVWLTIQWMNHVFRFNFNKMLKKSYDPKLVCFFNGFLFLSFLS